MQLELGNEDESRDSGGSRLVYEKGGLHTYWGDENDPVAPASPPKTDPPKPKESSGSSQEKAETKYSEMEFVLEGTAQVIADPNIVSNATIRMEGLGDVLTGNYYVESVTHVWSREGYSQEIEVKTNTYGAVQGPEPQPSAAATRDNRTESPPEVEESQYYTVKPGDTLWAIAKSFYGNGGEYQKIADANGIANANVISPGQKLLIP